MVSANAPRRPSFPGPELAREPQPKQVLYLGPSGDQFHGLMDAIEQAPGCERPRADVPTLIQTRAGATSWAPALGADQFFGFLERERVDLIVFDLRCNGASAEFARLAKLALDVLARLDAVTDIESRFGFHRVLVLVAGRSAELVDRTVLELGVRGVGRVLRQPLGKTTSRRLPSDPAFGARLAETADAMMRERQRTQRALCAAGGGVTGIFFELGVLKCLEDCLSKGAINSFDMYFGISAGAVVTGLIAAGYSVTEVMAAIAGQGDTRLPPVDLRVFRASHLDYPNLAWRLGLALATGAAAFWQTLVDRELPRVDRLITRYGESVGTPMRTHGFGRMLADALTAPGASNDFRRLPRPLFIGATDQDRREHVLFGAEGYDDVPISRAIQGSMSLNPAFSSTRIKGRYYEDGAVTRTSNFVEAIHRGADLIFTIDPFLPYVSRQPGFSHRRGMLYNIDQNVRTMSFTRFDAARQWALRRHPDVSSYTFLPANRLRRLMSVNPFDAGAYLEIWRGAYLSTLQRVRRLTHRMRGDLELHGVGLDLTTAEAVAERLTAADRLRFADFFADGRVCVDHPPLCLAHELEARLRASDSPAGPHARTARSEASPAWRGGPGIHDAGGARGGAAGAA